MANETLKHRGYDGSIEFSLEDGVLHGQVLFVNDLVTYEGETLAELTSNFEAAIDAYLSACADSGVQPDRPFRGMFNVRVGPELHKQCAILAAREGRTLNEFVCRALEVAAGASTPTQRLQVLRNDFVHWGPSIDLISAIGTGEINAVYGVGPWDIDAKARSQRFLPIRSAEAPRRAASTIESGYFAVALGEAND